MRFSTITGLALMVYCSAAHPGPEECISLARSYAEGGMDRVALAKLKTCVSEAKVLIPTVQTPSSSASGSIQSKGALKTDVDREKVCKAAFATFAFRKVVHESEAERSKLQKCAVDGMAFDLDSVPKQVYQPTPGKKSPSEEGKV